MTDAPDGRARRLPRFTFLWAFLLGIVVLTLLRPCLRRVPAPPPVQGSFPAVRLIAADGAAIDPASLKGSAWVVSIESVPCLEACAERRGRMAELKDALAGFHLGGIRLLSLEVDTARPAEPEPDHMDSVEADPDQPMEAPPAPPPAGPADPAPPLWIAARLDEKDLQAFGGLSRLGTLLLVDATGGLRGWYGADQDGFNEIYNRAQHVRSADPDGKVR
ncbi:MAG TPA: hypothetical protein VFD06_07255 [Candidatus Polarisedimenticolia bacterium]|nr:hypothetical protein [Candidatus Polarisedimenticolia bacterium]